MGPDEDSTLPAEDREHGRRKRPARRPRTRCCLLKGCERRFRPQRARQRYCSEECRQAARRWSRWKAQQSYRATAAGKEKRNEQSRRYRERVRKRQAATRKSRSGSREGNHSKIFFDYCCDRPGCYEGFDARSGDRPSSASVRARAGAPWNASGNGSGAGGARAQRQWKREPVRSREISPTY